MIEKIKPLPHQKVYFSYIAYDTMTDFFTGESFTQTNKVNIVMVSGIAKPEPMLEHLRSIAADVHLLRYPDHHYFTAANLEEIKQTITNWDVSEKIIVTTEKDAARLAIHKDELAQWNVRIAVLPIMIKFIGNEANFNHEINSYIFREKEEMNME